MNARILFWIPSYFVCQSVFWHHSWSDPLPFFPSGGQVGPVSLNCIFMIILWLKEFSRHSFLSAKSSHSKINDNLSKHFQNHCSTLRWYFIQLMATMQLSIPGHWFLGRCLFYIPPLSRYFWTCYGVKNRFRELNRNQIWNQLGHFPLICKEGINFSFPAHNSHIVCVLEMNWPIGV